MNRTKIEWADYTWNPIKGLCPEACWYCYARRMYRRFGMKPRLRLDYKELVAPAAILKPARIFVCSTMELFHPRILEAWRMEIFNIIASLSSLTFIVLTKHPENITKAMPDNVWLGVSVEGANDWHRVIRLTNIEAKVRFVSLEPFIGQTPDLSFIRGWDWFIIGRLTGHGRKHDPEPHALGWLVLQAKKLGIPIFMKDNLKDNWAGPLIQEFPALPEPGKEK